MSHYDKARKEVADFVAQLVDVRKAQIEQEHKQLVELLRACELHKEIYEAKDIKDVNKLTGEYSDTVRNANFYGLMSAKDKIEGDRICHDLKAVLYNLEGDTEL